MRFAFPEKSHKRFAAKFFDLVGPAARVAAQKADRDNPRVCRCRNQSLTEQDRLNRGLTLLGQNRDSADRLGHLSPEYVGQFGGAQPACQPGCIAPRTTQRGLGRHGIDE